MATKAQLAEQAQAQKDLRKLLQGQDTLRTIAEWTGSTAYVRVLVVKGGEIIDITHLAGEAMGEKTVHASNKPYGFKRGGYGYGKEFDVVYGIGRTLYPHGYKHTIKNCHSNDHSNGWDGVSTHRDGGYRFNQRSV